MIGKDYRTYKGIECLNSCIYNYLKNDNFKVSPSDIFFSSNGFRIRYRGKLCDRMIYSEQYKSNFKFLKLYMPGFIEDNYIMGDNENMKLMLISHIKHKERIIIRVSSSMLPYNKIFKKNQIVSHYINVIDYSYERNTFTVSDGCPPINTNSVYQGEIEADALIDNWCIMNGEYIILKYDNNVLYKIKSDSDAMFEKQIMEYIKSPKVFWSSKYKGIGCILTMFEDMRYLFESKVSRISDIAANISRQLYIEGFMQSKYFVLDKVESMNISDNIREKYKENIDNWNRIILKMVKSAIKGDINEFDVVVKDVKKVNESESRILLEAVQSINRN